MCRQVREKLGRVVARLHAELAHKVKQRTPIFINLLCKKKKKKGGCEQWESQRAGRENTNAEYLQLQ